MISLALANEACIATFLLGSAVNSKIEYCFKIAVRTGRM